MKKIILSLGICLAVAACNTTNTTTTPTTTSGKIKACLMEQGWQAASNGTLSVQGLYATAQEITGTCLKRLALENAGVTTETNQMATSILSGLIGNVQ